MIVQPILSMKLVAQLSLYLHYCRKLIYKITTIFMRITLESKILNFFDIEPSRLNPHLVTG